MNVNRILGIGNGPRQGDPEVGRIVPALRDDFTLVQASRPRGGHGSDLAVTPLSEHQSCANLEQSLRRSTARVGALEDVLSELALRSHRDLLPGPRVVCHPSGGNCTG
jgi:hypothetical protein